MNTTMIRYTCCVILLLLRISSAGAQVEIPQEFTQQMRILPQRISSCEPVRLDVNIQYLGTAPRKAWLPTSPKGDVTIEVRRMTPAPTRKPVSLSGYYLYTDAHVDNVPPADFTIPARASSLFPIEAIYDYHRRQFLFEEAGQYEVTVKSDISLQKEDGSRDYLEVSSQVTLTVDNYEGPDKELWKSIVSKGGLLGEVDSETSRALEVLIKEFPNSPYRPYALATLAGVFSRHKEVKPDEQRASYLKNIFKEYPEFAWKDRVAANLYRLLMNEGEVEQAQEVVKVLFDDPWAPPPLKYQIRQFKPSVTFAKDNRLDQSLTYQFAQSTPYAEVLAEISRRTGVSLSSSPELPKYKFSSPKFTESLRVVMRRLGAGLIWVRDGDGYKLMPKASVEVP